jgi:hypothetical protein
MRRSLSKAQKRSVHPGTLSPILSLHRASIGNNFISENGIVAVPGDEDQFVKSLIRKMNGPLSKERGRRFELSIPIRYVSQND